MSTKFTRDDTRRLIFGIDVFLGLNAVRALSIISLLLVFASSIFVLVTDIQAVNKFMKDASDTDLADCDYIESVSFGPLELQLLTSPCLFSSPGQVQYQTKPQASSGPS